MSGMLVLHPEFEVAAELDVSPATRHVGRDRHRADPTGLRNDVRFLLVEAGVEDGLDPLLFRYSESISDFSIEIVPTSAG